MSSTTVTIRDTAGSRPAITCPPSEVAATLLATWFASADRDERAALGRLQGALNVGASVDGLARFLGVEVESAAHLYELTIDSGTDASSGVYATRQEAMNGAARAAAADRLVPRYGGSNGGRFVTVNGEPSGITFRIDEVDPDDDDADAAWSERPVNSTYHRCCNSIGRHSRECSSKAMAGLADVVAAIEPSTLASNVGAALIAGGDGWRPRWPACRNAWTDHFGNTVSVHTGRIESDTVLIEFEYAIGGLVERLQLNPALGSRRIAAVIGTLALAVEE